jgi:uncharacterized membrane protein HdeD (DUF308 family)
MSSSQLMLGNNPQTVRDAVRTNSGLFLAQGVVTALLGIAAVIWPQVSSLAVELYVGWILLVGGVLGLGLMFLAPNAATFFWSLLSGALSLFAGLMLVWHPVEGVVSLTLVLVAFFIAEGVFQIAAAFAYRPAFPEAWGWMLVSGLVDLALAAVIMSGWPGSTLWALGLVVGVNLITSGVATSAVAIAVRRAVAA